MEDNGLTVYAHGVVLHSDRRVRVWDEDGVLRVVAPMRTGCRRELVSGFSRASQRNLAMVAANAGGTRPALPRALDTATGASASGPLASAHPRDQPNRTCRGLPELAGGRPPRARRPVGGGALSGGEGA